MKLKYKQKLIALLIGVAPLGQLFAQETASANKSTAMDANMILAIFAGILVIPIFFLAIVLVEVTKHKYKKESNSNALKSMLVLVGLFSVVALSAQEEKLQVVEKLNWFNKIEGTEWLLYFTILLEMIVIGYLSTRIIRTINPATEGPNKLSILLGNAKRNLSGLWGKMNNFRPIEEEKDLDTGHEYDGIRELNNVTPSWFQITFILSIIFAIGYMWRYHVAKFAPLQIAEYKQELVEAEKAQAEYLKLAADNVDETTVKMLDAAGIGEGQLVFQKNCAVCHNANGGGGAGPNLTDEYWLHGGGIADVFKSVKYGWQEKGMKSWKDELSSKQIAQVSSYILSLQGTKPAGGKAPEGELFKVIPVTDSKPKDSMK